MKQEQATLGIIAGGGSLPKALVEACHHQKRKIFVLALRGQGNEDLARQEPGAVIRLGAIGQAARLLKKAKVRDLVFIGSVRRPSVAEIRPDMKAMGMLIRVGFRLLGDDSLLKIILKEAEKEGFHVVGVDSVVPEILAPEGVYGKISPDAKDLKDIQQGVQVAKTLGQVDVGQAVIVQHGLVLAVEGIEGTAAMIKRTESLKRKGGGGVLVKVAKPQQDRRVDLPTIGPNTVQAVYDSGFKGIAVESGAALLAEEEEMMVLANRLGIFVMGVSCRN